MKLSYIKSILLAALFCAPLNLYPLFGSDLKEIERILNAGLANFRETSDSLAVKIGISMGNNLVTSGTKIIDTGKQTATELLDVRMEQLRIFGLNFEQKQIGIINYIINNIRLAPGYVAGTACLVGSIAMYWQALKDYLDGTDTDAKAQEALRTKIIGKIKAGTGFLVLGAFTLRFNRQIAHTFLGYEYPKA